MSVENFKVFVTSKGDGAITYTVSEKQYKVFLKKNDPVINKVFTKHFSKLKRLKNRHYVIAEWIARDLRAKGYVFKSYCNNRTNIRPVKQENKNQ